MTVVSAVELLSAFGFDWALVRHPALPESAVRCEFCGVQRKVDRGEATSRASGTGTAMAVA
jgi:hypothetical protein